jgi:hypothetical protein
MSTHAITLQLPIPLYEQIRSRARRARLTVETEVLNLVTTAVEEESLPDDMAAVVESLDLLDDTALWRAARSTLAPEKQEQLETLNFKQQSEGLTRSESEIHATLLHAYDRAVLVRARAAELLVERGHDVAELLRSQ